MKPVEPDVEFTHLLAGFDHPPGPTGWNPTRRALHQPAGHLWPAAAQTQRTDHPNARHYHYQLTPLERRVAVPCTGSMGASRLPDPLRAADRRGHDGQVIQRSVDRLQPADGLRTGLRRYHGRRDHHARVSRRRGAAGPVTGPGVCGVPDPVLRNRLVHQSTARRRLALPPGPRRCDLAVDPGRTHCRRPCRVAGRSGVRGSCRCS